MLGFAEEIDFKVEGGKGKQHRAKYIVTTQDAVFKCRTIRRKPDDLAYDPECVDYLKICYSEYVSKDGRASAIATGDVKAAERIPLRGGEFVAHRIYTRALDYLRRSYT